MPTEGNLEAYIHASSENSKKMRALNLLDSYQQVQIYLISHREHQWSWLAIKWELETAVTGSFEEKFADVMNEARVMGLGGQRQERMMRAVCTTQGGERTRETTLVPAVVGPP